MTKNILIIDDEVDIRELVADILKDEGFQTRVAGDSLKALEMIEEMLPQLVILDIWLQGSELDGLGVLEIIHSKYPFLPVIIISGHGTIETAVNAIKLGAYDYIEKPFTEDRLLLVVRRALEAMHLRSENAEFRRQIVNSPELIGCSSNIANLRASIDKVAPTNSRVFITGPSGCGKEVIARLIHQKSKRAYEPFVVCNVSTITPSFLEMELFGKESESLVAPVPRKIGALEKAHQGTLFIDEVADLPLSIQAKLLRFLQEHCFERVDGERSVKVDVRVIVATSRDIEEMVQQGKFRQDLYYRLHVVPMLILPLAERREDIPALCQYFIHLAENSTGLSPRKIAEDAMAALQAYNWPGNARQLKNVIEWLLIMAPGGSETPIRASMLSPEILALPEISSSTLIQCNEEIMALPLREAREVFEKHYLAAQIHRFKGNISRASSFVGMERTALHRKLKMLNITMALSPDSQRID